MGWWWSSVRGGSEVGRWTGRGGSTQSVEKEGERERERETERETETETERVRERFDLI